MLNETIVSITMSGIQELLVKRLERDGYVYPTLILMNENRHICLDDLLSKYPIILLVENSKSTEGIAFTCVSMRNRDEDDDAAIQELIREITFRHQPEAVGYFAQCLYKPMTRDENFKLSTDQMNRDPDAIRVFHNCFFVRGGGRKGFIMVTPYMKNEARQDDLFDPQAGPTNVVTQFKKSWEISSSILETRIPNPYL